MVFLHKWIVPKFMIVVLLVAMMSFANLAPAQATDNIAEQNQESEIDVDPLEGFNRVMFQVNLALDTLFLRPAAEMYTKLLPPIFQTGIRNFLRNLRAPIVLANDLLQGDFDRAGDTTARFLINTTVGIGGLRDQAGDWGYLYHSEDFGQTAAVWGVGSGAYLVLPIIGPTTPRDGIGRVVEYFADPFNNWAWNQDHDSYPTIRGALTATEARAANMETLDDLQRTSLDYYATIRSLYLQRRANEIRNGETSQKSPSPGITYNFDTEAPGYEQRAEQEEDTSKTK
ncbi:MAG: VacJ family lipoprotein [Alphaproteobacteria bacterium]|nr:VacJ family lipoprotein [Rhodospirillales bacterium]MCW9044871.1 VacJ family lipoprotein [Alphaproteobacteria bacterium]